MSQSAAISSRFLRVSKSVKLSLLASTMLSATALLLLVVVLVNSAEGQGVPPPLQISSPCDRHLRFYEQSLSSQLWALQMLDATAKIPTGLLYGSPMDLGNFDECVQIKDIKTSEGDTLSGKLCLVTAIPGSRTGGIKESPVNGHNGAVSERHYVNEMSPLDGSLFPNVAGLYASLGVCLPSSCTALDYALYLTNSTSTLLPAGSLFVADDKSCFDGQQKPFRAIDWVAIAIFIVFGLLAIGSTVYDLVTSKSGSRKELFLAFSWYTNGRKLFSTRKSAMDLSCLHGIRFLSMAWVVLNHRFYLNFFVPSSNQSVLMKKYIENWGFLFLQNGGMAVDSFFLLSGLLVAYVFLNGVHKGAKFNIFLYYLHRYIRLTPPLMILMLLLVSLVHYMGTGPLYESTWPTNCDVLWWKHLLYVNNYFSIDNTCVSHAWYLAADMQLYWLSPLVLIPLWKKPVIGRVLLGLFTLTGLAISFGICYHYKIVTHLKSAMLGADDAWNYTWIYYSYTHTRFTPWLVGVGFGYILHEIKKRPAGSFKMTTVQWLGVWVLAAFFMLVSLCGTFGMNQFDHEYNVVEFTFYNTFHRSLWALGIGLMIFACCTGYGGPVDTFLSWSFFLPLSKLTYGIYLYHLSVQAITSMTLQNKTYNDDVSTVADAFGDIVFASLVAIVISLVFESPFIVLEKVLLGGSHGKKKATPPAENDTAAILAKSKMEADPEAPAVYQVSNGSVTDQSDPKALANLLPH